MPLQPILTFLDAIVLIVGTSIMCFCLGYYMASNRKQEEWEDGSE